MSSEIRDENVTAKEQEKSLFRYTCSHNQDYSTSNKLQ
jgi:hypothetical protein